MTRSITVHLNSGDKMPIRFPIEPAENSLPKLQEIKVKFRGFTVSQIDQSSIVLQETIDKQSLVTISVNAGFRILIHDDDLGLNFKQHGDYIIRTHYRSGAPVKFSHLQPTSIDILVVTGKYAQNIECYRKNLTIGVAPPPVGSPAADNLVDVEVGPENNIASNS